MLRCGMLLLLSSLALAAPRDLRPRYGSGWAGFTRGSWVTMKVTSVLPKRVPSVQTQTTKLTEADKKKLSLERVTKNPLTEDRTQKWSAPASAISSCRQSPGSLSPTTSSDGRHGSNARTV